MYVLVHIGVVWRTKNVVGDVKVGLCSSRSIYSFMMVKGEA